MFSLTVNDLSQRFGSRKVFSGINLNLVTGQSLAVTGPNGSGKTTLLLTLLHQYHPDRGEVRFFNNNSKIEAGQLKKHLGFVSPYLTFYDQLTAEENLKFFTIMTGKNISGKKFNEVLELVGLMGRGDDPVCFYSSGMKQRLKYALAILNEPAFLFLDEPTSNLDKSGKAIVRDIISINRDKSIIVIASNEDDEKSLADMELNLV